MNLILLLESQDLIAELGETINTEETIILHNSLYILQNKNHFKQIFLFGKIYGTEKDYYIAYGYERDILNGKVFYYSNNCYCLPLPIKNGLLFSPLCFKTFQGDPSLVTDVTIEIDETTIPGTRKAPQVRRLKEEDRLASVVHQIINEAGVVPRGDIFTKTDGVVIESPGFEGLSTLWAREIRSFQHFCLPTIKLNTNIDIPEGCWQLQITPEEDNIILKSMYWPGLMFFHKIKTPKHGFLYLGYGKKSFDSIFRLSPYFT